MPHFSIQRDHLHLIVEADGEKELRLGLRGFIIALARQVNRVLQRTGSLWADRYHDRELGSPRETFNALTYVLNNDLKHGCRPADPARGIAMIDVYSSGPLFDGWTCKVMRATYRVPWPDMAPRTWMLGFGWRKHGFIDPRRTPGTRAIRR